MTISIIPAGFNLADFDFYLPEARIASVPLAKRSDSRMLVVDPSANRFADAFVRDLPRYFQAGDLFVMNNTRVLKARLFAKKPSGGAVELLVERLLSPQLAQAQMGVSKKPKVGQSVVLEDGTEVVVADRDGAFWQLLLPEAKTWLGVLEQLGHLPLPHYMNRADSEIDAERYQTVYAKTAGSVAAPTAGLHFDAGLLADIAARGIDRQELTLHVGAGTFMPIRVDDIRAHAMHSEHYSICAAAQKAHQIARVRSAKVCAIGTTSLRSLESWASAAQSDPGDHDSQDFEGETALFIYPGYTFKAIDALFTNFHLPKSSLFVLTCALAGTELMQRAYAHAVRAEYRFYSYGDAMLILPGCLALCAPKVVG